MEPVTMFSQIFCRRCSKPAERVVAYPDWSKSVITFKVVCHGTEVLLEIPNGRMRDTWLAELQMQYDAIMGAPVMQSPSPEPKQPEIHNEPLKKTIRKITLEG